MIVADERRHAFARLLVFVCVLEDGHVLRRAGDFADVRGGLNSAGRARFGRDSFFSFLFWGSLSRVVVVVVAAAARRKEKETEKERKKKKKRGWWKYDEERHGHEHGEERHPDENVGTDVCVVPEDRRDVRNERGAEVQAEHDLSIDRVSSRARVAEKEGE